MKRVIVLLLLSSFACANYKRVSIGPGDPAGVSCFQSCKQAHDSDDAIVECAAACPGAVVHDDRGCPSGWRSASVDGEPEAATGCVSSVHMNWRPVAKAAGVIAVCAVIIGAVLLALSWSPPTH